VAITVAVVLLRRRTGAPLAVWTAYVVAITPVLGLVLHNGDQIAADRYTYLPCVGWALLIGGGLTMTWRRSFSGGAWARAGVLGLATVTLALLAVLTWHQVGNWRDTQTLWTHALSVQPSGIAHTYVGLALEWDQQRDAALLHYREAVRRRPSSPTIQYMVGLGLERLGHAREAIGHYREAVRLRPQMADARGSLGLALAQAGETDEAEGQFREALRLDPRSAEIRNSYGVALGRMGQIDRANEQFREALRIDPGNREARAALSAAEAAERGRTGAKP